MSHREYKLAADPIRVAAKTPRREILQIADGHREVFVVVPDYCAVDVLEAVRRAYTDGTEDRAWEDEARRYEETAATAAPILTSLDSEDYNGPYRFPEAFPAGSEEG